MENIQAKIDVSKLQEAADKYALEGAINAIKEHYTGYNSPFKKQINEILSHTNLGGMIEIPDIIQVLNKALAQEMSGLANITIAKTYLPSITELFTGAPKEMKFSELLEKFVGMHYGSKREDYECEAELNSSHGWWSVKLKYEDKEYDLTFHSCHKEEEKGKHQLLSLPGTMEYDRMRYSKQSMKVTVDNATIELPFNPDVMHDKFISFIAGCVLAKTRFVFDVEDFDSDMFPHCHC